MILTFGDHGSTFDGSHGGGSKEELEAGLFTYTKKKFTFREFKYPENLPEKKQKLLEILEAVMDINFLNRDKFNQLDIVSTMSAIFNLPIPFCNQGLIIPEVLHYDGNVADSLYELFVEFIHNYAQVLTYVDAYIAKYNQMKTQKKILENKLEVLKEKISDIMNDSKQILKIESDYVEGKEMTEEDKVRYINFVGDMFKVMKEVRITLEDNAYAFDKRRYYFDRGSIYCSYIIRIMVTVCVIFIILLLSVSIKREDNELFSHFLTKGYPTLLLLVLFVILLFNMDHLVFLFTIVFGIYIWCTVSLGRLCWKYRNTIRELADTKLGLISTLICSGILLFFWIFSLFAGDDHQPLYRTLLYTLSGINIVLLFIAKERSIHLLLFFIFLLVFNIFYEIGYVSKYAFISDSYFACSIVPSFVFLGFGFYLILRKISNEIYFKVKLTLVSLFLFNMTAMLYYQTKELYEDAIKNNYFAGVVVPRTVFALCVLQMIYLFVSLYFKQILWKKFPPKKDRIFAFFTLLLIATFPSYLMIIGPYQPIYPLLFTIMSCGLKYGLKKIGLRNTLHFIFYTVLLVLYFFFMSGHEFSYVPLRFERIYVGFPSFKIFINPFIVFFEATGLFTYMLAILPLLTITFLSDYCQVEQGSSDTPMEAAIGARELKGFVIKESNDRSLEATIARNYLMVLFIFEMLQNGMTGYMLGHFLIDFIRVSPYDFTLRFLDWYVYILVIVFELVIEKI